KLQKTDQKNTARMKEIVASYGWPGKSAVGKDGAHAAWLLVQHADRDLEFQKRCLALMDGAVKKGEVDRKDMAYLVDRVLVGQGKKQMYGTQFRQKNGKLSVQPVEDEQHLDDRRKEVGLGPLAEYQKLMEKLYGDKNTPKK